MKLIEVEGEKVGVERCCPLCSMQCLVETGQLRIALRLWPVALAAPYFVPPEDLEGVHTPLSQVVKEAGPLQ